MIDFTFTNEFSPKNCRSWYFAKQGSGLQFTLSGELFFWDRQRQNNLNQQPKELSFQQAWDISGGLYLLLGQSPWNVSECLTAVADRLQNDPHEDRIVWLANPNDNVADWQITRMSVDPATQILADSVNLPLANYSLRFAAGIQLDIEQDFLGFILRVKRADIKLSSPEDLVHAMALPCEAGTARISLWQPGGPQIVLTPLTVSKDTAFFDAFDIGLRWYYPAHKNGEAYRSLRFRVFKSDALQNAMQLQAQITPFALTDTQITRLMVQGPADLTLASYYHSHVGRPVYLTSTESSGFCFQYNPAAEPAGALTMVPAGAFGLRVVPAEAMPSLLCGVAGAEYLLPDRRGNVNLVFHPDQAALVPGYPRQQRPVAGHRQGMRLSPKIKTAWVSLRCDSSDDESDQFISYYAQPETASLYELPKAANDEAIHYFNFLPLQAGKLAQSSGLIFPLAPFAGAAHDPQTALALEVEALSPERRALLIPSNDRPDLDSETLPPSLKVLPGDSPEPTHAVTPQGWLATFETIDAGKKKWTLLDLARVQTPDGSVRLSLQGIEPPLKTALLTSQQFLVASDADAFAPFFKDYTSLVLGDWRFDLSPKVWAQHHTIFILKNSKKSLAELAANPAAWSEAQAFNKNPAGISRTILAIIQQARQAHTRLTRQMATGEQLDSVVAAENSDFSYFLKVVDAPEWNGLLVLNAQVPLDALPKSLRGLAAGIDAAAFFAHHLGITQTPFKDEVQKPSSSLFGLISYTSGRSIEAPLNGDYGFDVRSLKVLFKNSTICDFSSKIALDIRRLFGSAAAIKDSATSAMTFNGVYQQKADGGSYEFSIARPSTYTLKDSVLTEVEVKQGRFFTAIDGTDQEPNETLKAGFALDGHLHFADIRDYDANWFDLFSYDQLDYSDLHIDFSFETNQPSSIRFAFNPAGMRLRLASSRVREDSFAAHFPVRARAVLAGTAGGPDTAGFTTVDLPFKVDSVKGSWYGVAADLQLGVINDIGDAIGSAAQLLWAWTPGSGKPQFMLGLKLPGGSGSKEISICGVLKAQIYSIELRREKNEYALMLNGVNLKVFGQTLPPTGSFNFYLFGDPGAEATPEQLGWYGAYKKNAEDEPSEPSTKQTY
ncbi:MAG: hypothetical protein AB1Z31_18575 [Desulfobacterales bacterium]